MHPQSNDNIAAATVKAENQNATKQSNPLQSVHNTHISLLQVMMNEESTAQADGAEQVEASPAPESTTADANDGDVNGSIVKTKGGCCSSTKKFFLYDSSRPEIQAFYFNQVRMSIYSGRQSSNPACVHSEFCAGIHLSIHIKANLNPCIAKIG